MRGVRNKRGGILFCLLLLKRGEREGRNFVPEGSSGGGLVSKRGGTSCFCFSRWWYEIKGWGPLFFLDL